MPLNLKCSLIKIENCVNQHVFWFVSLPKYQIKTTLKEKNTSGFQVPEYPLLSHRNPPAKVPSVLCGSVTVTVWIQKTESGPSFLVCSCCPRVISRTQLMLWLPQRRLLDLIWTGWGPPGTPRSLWVLYKGHQRRGKHLWVCGRLWDVGEVHGRASSASLLLVCGSITAAWSCWSRLHHIQIQIWERMFEIEGHCLHGQVGQWRPLLLIFDSG